MKVLRILALLAAMAIAPSAAFAQHEFGAAPSQNTSTTVTAGGTFQQVVPSGATRQGCLIENPITASETLFVFFGPIASATTGKSFELAAGQGVSCTTGTGQVSDQVSVTATTTGHTFKAAFQ